MTPDWVELKVGMDREKNHVVRVRDSTGKSEDIETKGNTGRRTTYLFQERGLRKSEKKNMCWKKKKTKHL